MKPAPPVIKYRRRDGKVETEERFFDAIAHDLSQDGCHR